VTEEVKFTRGNDRINQLAQRPDIAADLTQVELARRLGVTQAAISRVEQPHDLLLSTLNSYLGAIGGRASVIVTFADGHEAILDLSQLA
jgi:predicted transcriptional regulator